MDKLCYSIENEETLYFDLPDSNGIRIKGILRGSLTQPLAVIMHGRPGTGNELLPYLAAHYLHEYGISSIRLFMYDFEPKTRNILECTLETFASDFDEVIRQLRKRTDTKLFAIGHSYGGITILKAKAKLDGAVLWDPTHGSYWVEHADESDESFPEKTIGDLVIGTGGYGYVNSLKSEEYDKRMGDTTGWAAHKGYPLMVISAGKGAMTHLGKRYIAVADEPKKHVVIEDAHHQLEDSDQVISQLLKQTLDWLRGC